MDTDKGCNQKVCVYYQCYYLDAKIPKIPIASKNNEVGIQFVEWPSVSRQNKMELIVEQYKKNNRGAPTKNSRIVGYRSTARDVS